MDYEKAYNDLVAKVKKAHLFAQTDSTKNVLEDILPELRESEDERVRKSIVATIEQCPDDFLNPKNRDRMLDWLEKQKEPHIPWYDYQKSKDAGYTIVPNEEYEQLVKQKEQEPQVFCEAKAYDLGYKQGKEDAKKEQKPTEWSEEDYHWEGLVQLLRDYQKTIDRNSNNMAYEDVERYIGWVNSLRPQPKQEWSKEDETHLGWIIDCLDYWKSRVPDFADNYQSAINWLKSLRPPKDCSGCAKHLEGYISGRGDAENKLLDQFGILIMPEGELHMKPRWKPSEEQMEALRRAVNKLAKTDVADSVRLSIMYDNLKRL